MHVCAADVIDIPSPCGANVRGESGTGDAPVGTNDNSLKFLHIGLDEGRRRGGATLPAIQRHYGWLWHFHTSERAGLCRGTETESAGWAYSQ